MTAPGPAPQGTLAAIADIAGGTLLAGANPWLMAAGLLIVGAGAWLIWLTHGSSGDRRPIFVIALPALGCGGCMFLYPFVSLGGGLLVAGGVVAFCRQSASC